MENNQSSYNFWTWLVAILLALILLWMLLTGRGPSNACCGVPAATAPIAAETAAVTPIAAPSEPFSFNANCETVSHLGDASQLSWFNQLDSVKPALCSGQDLSASGDTKTITLTGTVSSETEKQRIADEVRAMLGSDVTIDNQIIVSAPVIAEPAPQPEPAMGLPVAKLYFATAKTALPNDYDTTIAPVLQWLNDHPDYKAVLSGYHDPRGNKAMNEELAKNRAKSVKSALLVAGIEEARIEMRKPLETEGDGNLAEARRVEVSVEKM